MPPQAVFKLPEFPDTPPIGFAGETTPDGLRTYMVVPAPVVKAIGGYIGEVEKMQQAGTTKAKEVEAL